MSQDSKTPAKVPASAPGFAAGAFDKQVDEFLRALTPSAEAERVAHELARRAKEAISTLIPEVDVVGLVSGDLGQGTAYGVAVPEVDIIASAIPHALTQHLQGRLAKGGISTGRLDARKLQKSAIRACTDMLVSSGGFKFRRSAFRGQEPKVTLMASPSLGIHDQAIPIDFSVNTMTPLYNAALVAECAKIDPRAKALILLVKRWAKDRGLCHAAKGHLPPYAWALLAVYFMQVGYGGSPLLPSLQGFKMASGPTLRRGPWPREAAVTDQRSVGNLFRDFVRFYSQAVDFKAEAVSVRLGHCAPASLHLTLQLVEHDDGSTEVGPSVEDPFEPSRNLGSNVTSNGFMRFREEFARADSLLRGEANLQELLEPWVPVERLRGDSEEARAVADKGTARYALLGKAADELLQGTPDSSEDVEQVLRWIEEDERQERQRRAGE